MKTIWDIAPKGIALLSFAILSLTIVHEWGYFWVIGSNFQTVASAYDYLSNSILWLPQNLLIILAAASLQLLFRMLLRRSQENVSDADFGLSTKRRQKRFGRNKWTAIASLTGSILFAIATYFFAPPDLSIVYFMPLLFGYMILYLIVTQTFEDRLRSYNQKGFIALLVIPVVLIFDFGLGVDEAHLDIAKFNDTYVLTPKTDTRSDATSNDALVQVLRSFDKGLLLRDPRLERVYFLRWDSIKSLSRPSYSEGTVSRGCKRFPTVCGLSTPEP
jgi:hypothetical protein